MENKRVLIVGSARQSTGGITSVLELYEKMPHWQKYKCYWLGTQLHGKITRKLQFCIVAWIKAVFIIWKYDIVHFHTTPDKLGLLIQLPILLMSKLGRKKSIMHIHVGNQLNDNTRNQLFIWWMNHCDIVVLLAKKWERLLHESYPTVSTKTSVVYNPCNGKTYVPMEHKEKYIIYVGALNPNKSPIILLKAWQKIHNDFPDWRVKFMGGSILLEQSKQDAIDMGISESVDFLGFCKGETFENNFKKASIYVMCSYNEGFPMSVLEAWCYGAAVTSTPVGGLPDVIVEGKNCLTFNFGDDEELAKNLSQLIRDSKLRKEMSEYSQQFANEIFSIESISLKLDTIYQDLLA